MTIPVAKTTHPLQTAIIMKCLSNGIKAGVGNDFFPGGVQGGGFGPRAQGGIRGVDFWTQKLTNFDQNSNFSLF